MYFGTGNPAPFPGQSGEPWGASRPGANLYTDSIVKLDAKTGQLQWYHQATPHDLYDWDFQDPPILTEIGGREVAIGAGKSGLVIAVDAETGKQIWKTPVGEHNGHDNDGLRAMKGETSKLKGQMVVAPGHARRRDRADGRPQDDALRARRQPPDRSPPAAPKSSKTPR